MAPLMNKCLKIALIKYFFNAFPEVLNQQNQNKATEIM